MFVYFIRYYEFVSIFMCFVGLDHRPLSVNRENKKGKDRLSISLFKEIKKKRLVYLNT